MHNWQPLEPQPNTRVFLSQNMFMGDQSKTNKQQQQQQQAKQQQQQAK